MIKNLRNKAKNKKGFTLIELIVVVVIVIVLAAVLVPTVLKYIEKANEASCKSDAATLLAQIQSDYAASQASETGITMPSAISGVTVTADTGNTAVTEASKNEVKYGVTAVAGTTGYKEVTSLAYNNGKYTATWTSNPAANAEAWNVTKNAGN